MGSRNFDLADQAIAQLVQRQKEYQDELFLFTVPLHFFHQEARIGQVKGHGTGVLVRLNQRFFILTAGHCVQEAGDGEVAIGIRKEAHVFSRRFHSEYRYDPKTQRDFGFFEIPQEDVGTIEAFDHTFLPESRLAVFPSEYWEELGDPMIISGNPLEHYQGDPDIHPKTHMFTYLTIPAGSSWAPVNSAATRTPGYQTLDLWAPQESNLEVKEGKTQSADLPKLLGASGGGLWAVGMSDDMASWEAKRISLAGIHIASQFALPGSGDKDDIFFELLIGHHLHLIADSFADLGEYILDRWPGIETYPL